MEVSPIINTGEGIITMGVSLLHQTGNTRTKIMEISIQADNPIMDSLDTIMMDITQMVGLNTEERFQWLGIQVEMGSVLALLATIMVDILVTILSRTVFLDRIREEIIWLLMKRSVSSVGKYWLFCSRLTLMNQ